MDQTVPDAIRLAQSLVRCSTVDGANEKAALEEPAALLRAAGFTCFFDDYSPQHAHKASLIARLCPEDPSPSLLFGGHIDTVPFGNAPWALPPLSGHIENGRLHGRGSADMKSGVAAMICAALTSAPRLRGRDLILHIYGGEEAACSGSFQAIRFPHLFGQPGAAIIAEPSGNQPLAGHKGALWLAFESSGRTAHSSMPEQGVNALSKLLPAAARLLEAAPQAEHAVLGRCTMALTSLHSGLNSNSIPDQAVLTADLRTVPGQDHQGIRETLAQIAGPEISLRTLMDAPPVWTDPCLPWCVSVRRRLAGFFGREPAVAAVPFSTDASSLRRLLPNLPLFILGPGEPSMAHKTDEYCALEQISAAQAIYEALIRDWYGLD